MTLDRAADHPAPLARRRPSGEPPPLPRPLTLGTRGFLVACVLVVVLWATLATDLGARLVGAADEAVLEVLTRLRADGIVDVADAVASGLGSPWTFRIVAWPILLVLVAVRRFQHLVVVLLTFLVVPVVDGLVGVWLGRMRPTGATILGSWDGYAHPSVPVANLGLGLTALVFTAVPAGRWRARAVAAAAALVGLLVAARLLLAVDHPSDVAAALVTGIALPAAVFRLVTPEDVFPVTYRPGVRAHLDVGGRRGEAIRTALARQAGLRVARVEPFHLGASAGSTPLRLVTAGGDGDGSAINPPRQLFGKLYASTHMWSDRWYKLVRTVRYGRLEDERPFNAVRRLVQHEDHMLRVMRAAGLPAPEPYGIVEITPEREYLIVTEFLDAAELTESPVTDETIDDALAVVRRMWDAGLAHRDIKPGNILVRDGCVVLIDVAFAELRPTPWRQAVDLANMMLTLALCSSPERVYARALEAFSPAEVGEAFAASRGVTIPAQLRTMIRTQDQDLIARFRALAPPTPPVAIQRWSLRRFALTLAVVGGIGLAVAFVVVNLRLAGLA